MNNQNLKKNIFEKIQKKEVKKIPRWIFLTKRFLIWSFFGISIFLGAVVFSILLKNIFSDFGAWYKLKSIFIPWKLLVFWLLTLIIFLSFSYKNLRETKKGFKYSWFLILSTSLLASILFGFGFYKFNWADKFENQILTHSKFYKNIKIKHKKELLKILTQKNIDPKEFFGNQKIVELQEKYQKIDTERIEKLKKILKKYENRNNINYSKLKEMYVKIQKQKRKIDEQRFLRMIEEFEKK